MILCNDARIGRAQTKLLLRIMKLTAIIIFSACLAASANGKAQTITLSVKNAPLEKVFESITKQTGFTFLYKDKVIEKAEPVSLNVTNVSLESVLQSCFKNQPLSYKIFDKTIVIGEKNSSPSVEGDASTALSTPPPIDVHGRIVNENGEPVAGVAVQLKGNKTKGTTTNANGEFTLTGVDDNAILVFSGTNIETFEKKLNGKNDLGTLSAVTKVNALEEVTVNKGYYSEKKDLTTGDVTTISSKEISRQPVSNVLQALEGRVPGMVITQNTGVPGGSFNVLIRGKNSIQNGTDPLFVVDGVPYPSQVINTISQNLQGGSPLNFLNIGDIERIDVLKDADATSIYGSRAANGAVLITTKKGKPGELRTHFNLYSGIGEISNMVDLLNSQQYLQMRREAFKNDGVTTIPSSAYDLKGVWDTTRYTNWQKVLIGNKAHYYDVQGSISGGTTNTQYLVAGNFHRETTVYPTGRGNGPDTKASVHFDLNNKSSNGRFGSQISGSYVSDINEVALNDYTTTALTLAPVAPPLYTADGSLNWAPINPGQPGTWTNPLSQGEVSYKGKTSNLIANSVLSYKIIPGLDVEARFGFTRTHTDETILVPTTTRDPARLTLSSSGSSSFNSNNSQSWIIEPQVNYNINIGKGSLSALVGTTWQETVNEGKGFDATGFTSDAFLANIQAASSVTVASVANTDYKYNALFGRVNYNWLNKYLINLSARRDGSSRFGPGKQFSNFGSVGTAWIFSNEHFAKSKLHFLSFGKIAASYGTTGNDQIGDYRFMDLYGSRQYAYQGAQGLYPTGLFNSTLAWELNKKLELSLNMRFLQDRISIEAVYYRSRTSNQLLGFHLNTTTGFTNIATNLPATVQNTSKEILLQTENIRSKNFNWGSSINITIPKNKLLSFNDFQNSGFDGSNLIIGEPITIQRVYHVLGVDPTTGVYQFADKAGNPISSPDPSTDRTVLIDIAPKYYGGFSNDFKYKGFSLNLFFQYVKQLGATLESNYSTPGLLSNAPVSYLDRWKVVGDVSKYQKATQKSGPARTAYNYIRYGESDFAYEDASYIRLKNLSLSWELPQAWKNKLHAKSFRVYFLGQNLFTITKYHGLDPETKGVVLPPLKVYVLGADFTF